MIEKAKNWASVGLSIAVIAGVYIVPGIIASNADKAKDPTCTTESISYETERQDDDSYDVGYEETSTYGQEGQKEVCVDSDGNLVSEEVIEEPVTEIVTVGTREEEPEYYHEDNYVRSGAICNDGSYSSATGSGACSWHGGVAQWRY